MKYYYLNSDKQILGSHTVAEMKKMLNEGMIHSDTLIARAGDNAWKKVSDLNLLFECEMCSTWNTNDSIPCKMGVIACIAHTVTNAFVLKSRSRRKECWVSFLFLGAFGVFLTVLPGFLIEDIDSLSARYNFSGDSFIDLEKLVETYPSDIVLDTYVIFFFFYCLFAFISLFSLMVRRFYDMGYTLLFPLLAYIMIPFIYVCAAPFILKLTPPSLLFLSVVLYVPQLIVLAACLLVPGAKCQNKYGSVSIG